MVVSEKILLCFIYFRCPFVDNLILFVRVYKNVLLDVYMKRKSVLSLYVKIEVP